MKIFQIGFNRCGTTSLHSFFKKNGLVSIHWADRWLARWIHQNYQAGRKLLEGIEQFQFYSDMEDAPHIYAHIVYYKLLDKQYPNSKFILNVRDKDHWLLSRLRYGRYCEEYARAHGLTVDQTVAAWSQQWDNHLIDVLTYFQGRDNLLVFDIEKHDIGYLVSFFPELKLEVKDYWEVMNATPET
jgi:hypothetical protein